MCKDSTERDYLTELLESLVEKAKERHEATLNPGTFARLQRHMLRVWKTNLTQVTSCVVIIASYITTLIEAQVSPEVGSNMHNIFFDIECFFTTFFMFELLLNFGANFWRPFISEWPNMFDAFLVITSIVGLFASVVPGVYVLRMFRIARLLRIMRVVK